MERLRKDVDPNIGLALRRRRRQLGRSQESIAADAEIERSYLARLEAGQRRPTFSVLRRLEEVLGLVGELTAEEPIPKPTEPIRPTAREVEHQVLGVRAEKIVPVRHLSERQKAAQGLSPATGEQQARHPHSGCVPPGTLVTYAVDASGREFKLPVEELVRQERAMAAELAAAQALVQRRARRRLPRLLPVY